jgi:hypothetical protein
MVWTLTLICYHQEKSWNGTVIKEEPKDEVTADDREERLDR